MGERISTPSNLISHGSAAKGLGSFKFWEIAEYIHKNRFNSLGADIT